MVNRENRENTSLLYKRQKPSMPKIVPKSGQVWVVLDTIERGTSEMACLWREVPDRGGMSGWVCIPDCRWWA